ncbi:hypothetical protein K443DRAFT_10002 [Laccaria amethystina LaAM-08-1]|uniref:Uncharacterized protein n=1 Tax=Laccaria amethystina LaAM-08-1 TaxID=1095629 RepID=A0A0C9XMH9_9AGAR|nr:hypothetical protein K443DRAFT_10002 [Laccaria amethystina LaAM-08-1]
MALLGSMGSSKRWGGSLPQASTLAHDPQHILSAMLHPTSGISVRPSLSGDMTTQRSSIEAVNPVALGRRSCILRITTEAWTKGNHV